MHNILCVTLVSLRAFKSGIHLRQLGLLRNSCGQADLQESLYGECREIDIIREWFSMSKIVEWRYQSLSSDCKVRFWRTVLDFSQLWFCTPIAIWAKSSSASLFPLHPWEPATCLCGLSSFFSSKYHWNTPLKLWVQSVSFYSFDIYCCRSPDWLPQEKTWR